MKIQFDWNQISFKFNTNLTALMIGGGEEMGVVENEIR